MIRPEDGVDMGLWKSLDPRRLVIPLDTHLYRIGWGLRMTEQKSPGLAAARDLTAFLRRLDPKDPVRFDFCLSRLGILDQCSRRAPARRLCPLYGYCRHA